MFRKTQIRSTSKYGEGVMAEAVERCSGVRETAVSLSLTLSLHRSLAWILNLKIYIYFYDSTIPQCKAIAPLLVSPGL